MHPRVLRACLLCAARMLAVCCAHTGCVFEAQPRQRAASTRQPWQQYKSGAKRSWQHA